MRASAGAHTPAVRRTASALVKDVGRRKEPSKELLQRLKAHLAQERARRKAEPKNKKAKVAAPVAAGPAGPAPGAGPAELLCEALRLRVV